MVPYIEAPSAVWIAVCVGMAITCSEVVASGSPCSGRQRGAVVDHGEQEGGWGSQPIGDIRTAIYSLPMGNPAPGASVIDH